MKVIEEINKIENKLNSMKEIDKKVFIDFYYASKSIKDIAKENKITEFSVKCMKNKCYVV